jgi:hypothetical protein
MNGYLIASQHSQNEPDHGILLAAWMGPAATAGAFWSAS